MSLAVMKYKTHVLCFLFCLGIVVQDCLAVMENLLKSNNSNQSFFREARYMDILLR